MERAEFEIKRVAERISAASVRVPRRAPMQEGDVVGFFERITEQLPVAAQLGAPFVAGGAVGGEGVALEPIGPFAQVLAQSLLRIQIDKDKTLPGVDRDRR